MSYLLGVGLLQYDPLLGKGVQGRGGHVGVVPGDIVVTFTQRHSTNQTVESVREWGK